MFEGCTFLTKLILFILKISGLNQEKSKNIIFCLDNFSSLELDYQLSFIEHYTYDNFRVTKDKHIIYSATFY